MSVVSVTLMLSTRTFMLEVWKPMPPLASFGRNGFVQRFVHQHSSSSHCRIVTTRFSWYKWYSATGRKKH